MEMTPVQSTQVASVGYDAATQTMAVQFKAGGLYEYAGVPADVAAAAVKAESIGRFLAQNVKNKYRYTKADKK
jgi:hypothetical protein